MPTDQPVNPRIRTKVLKLESVIDDALFDTLEALRCGRIDVVEYQQKAMRMLGSMKLAKTFAAEIDLTKNQDEQNELVRRHVEGCRYTMLLYKVNEGEVHAPHQHHNLISTQVVVEGKIHLREYDRVGRDGGGRLNLRLVRDAILSPGDVFQASEWSRNVHWFCGVEGPAVLLNINARGYEAKVFAQDDDGAFGRRYLDPGKFDGDGLITCEEIDEAQCARRFHGRSLAGFPAPGMVSVPGPEMTIAL